MADISSHVSSYSTTRCLILPGLTEQISLANSTFDWRLPIRPCVAQQRRVRSFKVSTYGVPASAEDDAAHNLKFLAGCFRRYEALDRE
ncbi:hypothetical protein V8C42DRAFT_316968 [Trichoderma barbatum]